MQVWFDVEAPIEDIGRIRERCEKEFTGREVVVCPFQRATLVRCASQEIADRVRQWVELPTVPDPAPDPAPGPAPASGPTPGPGPVPDGPAPVRRRRVRAA